MSVNLKLVTDDEEFSAQLQLFATSAASFPASPYSLTVVDFFTTWCGPCKQMETVIQTLALRYPNVLFLKVDADQCFETAMRHDVKGVPLFVLYDIRKTVVDSVQGAQATLLESKIVKYLADVRQQSNANKSRPAIGNGSSIAATTTEIQGPLVDLTPFVDLPSCKCLNDLAPSSFDAFLTGKKLFSGKGSGKVLLLYNFKEKVFLHSFTIKGRPETGPKTLRVYANHPRILDFGVIGSLAPSQEVTLSAKDLEGENRIPLRPGSFNAVTNLQIFVTDVMNIFWKPYGYHRVDLEALTFHGVPHTDPKKKQHKQGTESVTITSIKDPSGKVASDIKKVLLMESSAGKVPTFLPRSTAAVAAAGQIVDDDFLQSVLSPFDAFLGNDLLTCPMASKKGCPAKSKSSKAAGKASSSTVGLVTPDTVKYPGPTTMTTLTMGSTKVTLPSSAAAVFGSKPKTISFAGATATKSGLVQDQQKVNEEIKANLMTFVSSSKSQGYATDPADKPPLPPGNSKRRQKKVQLPIVPPFPQSTTGFTVPTSSQGGGPPPVEQYDEEFDAFIAPDLKSFIEEEKRLHATVPAPAKSSVSKSRSTAGKSRSKTRAAPSKNNMANNNEGPRLRTARRSRSTVKTATPSKLQRWKL